MEKSNIKVSIIVPAFNVEGYIDDCLNSLINQTLKEIEIIVINDGSTDRTLDIIKKYEQSDSRIILINQENKGLSSARNSGLKFAKGEYIGFVDSDDWVDEDYFEKLYLGAKHNNADMSVASIFKHKINYNKYNAKYKKEQVVEKIQDKIKLCQDKNKRFFYVWNKLVRAKVIKNNNLEFPVGRVFEDVVFTTKTIFYSNKIISIPNIKYHYIERAGSIVKSKSSEKKRNDHDVAYTELQTFAKENNIELPERLNYTKSFWKYFFIKVYEGSFVKKITLFGFLPILKLRKREA